MGLLHVACYRDCDGYSPQNINIENIIPRIPFFLCIKELIDAYDSISSLHVIGTLV